MPIRGFDYLLRDRNLVREAPLSALKDTRLGIDADLYVRRLLSNPQTREPFVAALGGVPLALEEHITKEMRVLEQARVKPIFVFSGLHPQKRERPLSSPTDLDTRPQRRQQGWEHYEKNRNDQAIAAFASTPMQVHDVMRTVHRCFLHRKTEFVVAPYLSSAQLVYLERSPKAYTHATWSSHDFLMFEGVERLILDVDFKTQTIKFVIKSEVLRDLGGLSPDQLTDLGILAGSANSPSIPIPDWSLQTLISLVRRHSSGQAAITAAQTIPPTGPAPDQQNLVQQQQYMETFLRAKSLIRFSLVLSAEEGRVVPLPLALPNAPSTAAAEVPQDIHDIFSYRLPDEVYFQLFRGLISPQVLGALTSGYWVEQAPLCGGESSDYKRFLRDIITEHPQSPRCTALALLSSSLNPFWKSKAVSAIYYFDPQTPHPIHHNESPVLKALDRLQYWHVPASVIEDELRRQSSSTIDIRLCLGATEPSQMAARTRVVKNPVRPLEKKDEVVANTLWRFLELRGFLTSSHTPNSNGRALLSALRSSRVNDKFQEPLYLAIELARAGGLHPRKFGDRTYSGGPNLGGESDKENAMLAMRVLSIVSLNFRAEPWTGPVSRSLLVFNSFLQTLIRSLRALLEATSVNLLLKGDARRSREDYLEIALSLPFRNDTNTGMGVLWKGWCDACAHVGTQMGLGSSADLGGFVPPKEGQFTPEELAEHKENLEEVKQAVSGMLDGGFGESIRDVRAELARGVRFWDTVLNAIRIMHKEKAMPGMDDLAAKFEAANRWLEPFRP